VIDEPGTDLTRRVSAIEPTAGCTEPPPNLMLYYKAEAAQSVDVGKHAVVLHELSG
jgi:hypothetical protein